MGVWAEVGRWNPLSLILLAPVWSYRVSGSADHWWFVSRSRDQKHYYSATFCLKDGKSHISALTSRSFAVIINQGLQYPGSRWWKTRGWSKCQSPRSKIDLDGLVQETPIVKQPYSWMVNNCQHFAASLQDDPCFAA